MIAGRCAAALGVLLAALALGAGGPYTARLSPADLRHIRTVAVVSAVGSSFLFEHVRDTQFEWMGPPDSRFLEISDWGIDAQITRDVTRALVTRFTVRPIAFTPANFSSLNDDLLKHASLDLNGDPAIDAYVFVLRDWHWDEIGHSVHDVGGLGIYRRDRTGGPPRLGVFACYRIVVVDALTGDIIASRAALLRDGDLPWIAVDASLWPKTPNDLNDVEKATLATDESRLVDETLGLTLEKMNLAR